VFFFEDFYYYLVMGDGDGCFGFIDVWVMLVGFVCEIFCIWFGMFVSLVIFWFFGLLVVVVV